MSGALVDVALPLALPRPLTYSLPDDRAARAVPGARALVPLGRRQVTGILLGEARGAPSAQVREVLALPDPEPVLSRALLLLARHIARHYASPPGLVVRAMLPKALLSAGRRSGAAGAGAGEVVVEIAEPLEGLLERERRFVRAARQREAYEALERLGGRADLRLLARLGVSRAAVRALARRHLVRIHREPGARDPFADLPTSPPPGPPTAAQRRAVEALLALPPGGVALLSGVTGSGKTLVYLEFLRHVVAAGRGAIVLVPEIALTPQTVARFRGVFGDAVAVLHSALSDGERYAAWRALRSGERRVAVGARSAVFAPVEPLGAVVVDEEHEPSYKQAEAPRYHARDLAVVRARLEGAVAVLGSATPSLESWGAVAAGRYALVALPERIGARSLPHVEVVDARLLAPGPESGPVPWSEPLDAAIEAALARGEQVMVLLNRRGFSRFVQCPACGHVWSCPHCAITLTYHRVPPGLRCHHCDHRRPPPEACSECGTRLPRLRGVGTQQVEEFLARRFPAARIARMDLDTTGRKWAHHRILDRVQRGLVDVLVGTQMIAKGLDYPRVTVVGVVDADVGLHLPDFRAAEWTFDLLTQVAGRAGRGELGGRVFVQTRSPDHPAIRLAAAHDMSGFAEWELAQRREPAYPPHVGMVNCILTGTVEARVSAAAQRLGRWLRALAAARPETRLAVLGPAPCPLERVRRRWRWHVLLKSPDPDALTRVTRFVAERAPAHRGARLALDRDPVSLL